MRRSVALLVAASLAGTAAAGPAVVSQDADFEQLWSLSSAMAAAKQAANDALKKINEKVAEVKDQVGQVSIKDEAAKLSNKVTEKLNDNVGKLGEIAAQAKVQTLQKVSEKVGEITQTSDQLKERINGHVASLKDQAAVATGKVTEQVGQLTETATQFKDKALQVSDQLKEKVKDKAAQVTDKIKDKVADVKEQAQLVKDKAGQSVAKLGELSTAAQAQLSGAADTVFASARGIKSSALDFAAAMQNQGFLTTLRSGALCKRLSGALSITASAVQEQLAKTMTKLPIDPSTDPKECITLVNATLANVADGSLGKAAEEALKQAALLISERTSAVLCQRGADGISDQLGSLEELRTSKPAEYTTELAARLKETVGPLFDKYSTKLCTEEAPAEPAAAFELFGMPLFPSHKDGSLSAVLVVTGLVAVAMFARHAVRASRTVNNRDLENGLHLEGAE